VLYPDEMILLCDFETTGLAQEEGSKAIQFAGLFLRPDMTIESDFNYHIDYRDLQDPIPLNHIHGIDKKTLSEKGMSKKQVVEAIQKKLIGLHRDGVRRIYLSSDNSFFDQTFAYKLGLIGKHLLHYNPLDFKCLCRMAGVKRPERFNKKHCAMNDTLNWYRSVLISYDRLKMAVEKRRFEAS